MISTSNAEAPREDGTAFCDGREDLAKSSKVSNDDDNGMDHPYMISIPSAIPTMKDGASMESFIYMYLSIYILQQRKEKNRM
jgi:hypothetical protein